MNKWLKTHQPTIQSIGILLVFIALLVSIKQNQIYKNEVEILNRARAEEDYPTFEISIKYDLPNVLSDKFIINSIKPEHILQKEEIVFVDDHNTVVLENYGTEFKSYLLKKEITKTLEELFNYKNNSYEPFHSSYPIAIKFHYADNGIVKQKTKLYKYIFKAYFSNSKCKIKSEGIEFIRDFDINDDIKDVLFKYNIEKCLLSTIPGYKSQLKEKTVLKDSILSPLYELAELNIQFIKHIYMIGGDSLERGIEYYYPISMWADEEGKQKEELLKKIIRNSDKTSVDLWNSFVKVHKTEEIYKHLSSLSHIDSIMPFTIKTVYQSEFEQWNEVNNDFKKAILNEVKMN